MRTSLGARALICPSPVLVVGTYDAAGRPNVMTVAWGGICCSKPPCVSIAVREATHTHGSLMERKAFTVSIPSSEQAAATDYFGIVSGRDEDKFAATGLTATRSALVDAPFVDEFPLVLECEVVHVAELGLHTLFVGEIKDVKADDWGLGEDGKPSVAKMAPILWTPFDNHYYALGDDLGQGFSIGRNLREK